MLIFSEKKNSKYVLRIIHITRQNYLSFISILITRYIRFLFAMRCKQKAKILCKIKNPM